MKKFLGTISVAILGGVLTLGGYKMLLEEPVVIERTVQSPMQTVQTNYTPSKVTDATTVENATTNFTIAAEKTVHAVVHVKNTAIKSGVNSWEDLFNGPRKYERVGTGSGVIISPDGYIITNNHVIDGASALEITLNNQKKYKAELIGADSKNDIALLKINADEALPYIPFANSDAVKIGEWVLAVGNPYNLTSTVTAGIVSAKGRDLEGNSNVDAFIQTDAAVNPGNSGGALVNTRGELVGINTAITSRTGSFIGYSFAVPSNIAKKVIDDLLEYGSVQEAVIGISYSPNEDKTTGGVKIVSLTENGGAEKAGLKEGDIIVKVNEVKISKFSELSGQLTAKRPGDLVEVTVNRKGSLLTKKVELSKKNFFVSRAFGIILKDLSKKDLKKFDIKGGAKITQNNNENLQYYGVKTGFIITKINKKEVLNASEAVRILDSSFGKGTPVSLEVINLKGERERYGFR